MASRGRIDLSVMILSERFGRPTIILARGQRVEDSQFHLVKALGISRLEPPQRRHKTGGGRVGEVGRGAGVGGKTLRLSPGQLRGSLNSLKVMRFPNGSVTCMARAP